MIQHPCRRVAFVDDDEDLRRANVQSLTLAGFEPMPCSDAESALTAIGGDFDGVVVSDLRMPGMDGLELFRHLNERDADLPVILITGHADIQTAVAAVQRGAYDFLSKPYLPDRLIASVQRALEKRALVLENRQLRKRSVGFAKEGPLLGTSPAIERLRRTIAQIADVNVDVLIQGATGTGKSLVATMLHAQSGRARHNMVTINAGALPETLVESELFGHVSGAFSGAQHARIGRIEQADRSTLFLDDVEAMREAVQHKMQRVLETREVTPLGGNTPRPVDLRVLAATNVDLAAMVSSGAFSASLYYRLNGLTITLPPLRERREDVALLFQTFLVRAAQRLGRAVPKLTPGIWRRLKQHEWPGNVRELLNFAEHVALGLESPDSGSPLTRAASPESLKQRVGQYEAALIEEALQAAHGDVQAVLTALDLPRKTFYDKITRHEIDLARFKSNRPRSR